MAIIICPECSKEVSDGAMCCPHCGYNIRKHLKKEKIKAWLKQKKLWIEHKRTAFLSGGILLGIFIIVGVSVYYNQRMSYRNEWETITLHEISKMLESDKPYHVKHNKKVLGVKCDVVSKDLYSVDISFYEDEHREQFELLKEKLIKKCISYYDESGEKYVYKKENLEITFWGDDSSGSHTINGREVLTICFSENHRKDVEDGDRYYPDDE